MTETESDTKNAGYIRGDRVTDTAHQILSRLQVLVDGVWADEKPQRECGGTALSEAEAALAMAIAIGVLRRIIYDSMTPAQVDFAEKVSGQFAIVPMPVDSDI